MFFSHPATNKSSHCSLTQKHHCWRRGGWRRPITKERQLSWVIAEMNGGGATLFEEVKTNQFGKYPILLLHLPCCLYSIRRHCDPRSGDRRQTTPRARPQTPPPKWTSPWRWRSVVKKQVEMPLFRVILFEQFLHWSFPLRVFWVFEWFWTEINAFSCFFSRRLTKHVVFVLPAGTPNDPAMIICAKTMKITKLNQTKTVTRLEYKIILWNLVTKIPGELVSYHDTSPNAMTHKEQSCEFKNGSDLQYEKESSAANLCYSKNFGSFPSEVWLDARGRVVVCHRNSLHCDVEPESEVLSCEKTESREL